MYVIGKAKIAKLICIDERPVINLNQKIPGFTFVN